MDEDTQEKIMYAVLFIAVVYIFISWCRYGCKIPKKIKDYEDKMRDED